MSAGLDVIILDDEKNIADHLGELTESFYSWGNVYAFSDILEARTFCFNRDSSLAIFVLDMFLGGQTAFDFIEAVTIHYPMAAEDSIIITGPCQHGHRQHVHGLGGQPFAGKAYQTICISVCGAGHCQQVPALCQKTDA